MTNSMINEKLINLGGTDIGNGFTMLEVKYPDFINEIGEMRVICWKDEQGVDSNLFSKKSWLEKIDETAFHWIVFKNNAMVASARFSIHSNIEDAPYGKIISNMNLPLSTPIGSINRLVVLPEYRHLGISKHVDSIRLEKAKQLGVKHVLAQPRDIRVNPLISQGFNMVGEFFMREYPGLPFFLMVLNI
jgi:hypothetical protein